MPPRSTRPRPASTGRSRRALFTTISAACRHSPARGSRLGGQRVKVLRSALAEGTAAPGTVIGDDLTIACGDGAVRLLQVQRAGKGVMSAADFLRGQAVPAGTVLA